MASCFSLLSLEEKMNRWKGINRSTRICSDFSKRSYPISGQTDKTFEPTSAHQSISKFHCLAQKQCIRTKAIVVPGLHVCIGSFTQTNYPANANLSRRMWFLYSSLTAFIFFTGFFTFRQLKRKSNSDSIHNKRVVDRSDEREISLGV